MNPSTRRVTLSIAVLSMGAWFVAAPARAEIPGVAGLSFTLTARADRISTPDGGSFLLWGFTSNGTRPQYPGPTLIVEQGASITVNVVNQLPASFGQRVSLSFPGQTGVTAACSAGSCVQGPVTMEANTGSTVTYTFTATRPGTFLYSSGSRPDLQVEMGLFGALIVRSGTAGQAYNTPESAYDQEYLFLLSEIDSRIHDMVELWGVAALDASGLLANPFTNYWFINGRNAPDTMAEASLSRLPTQPYNALPRTHPGDRVLMRVIGGGREMHPFHHHGNHARVIAVDGFPKQSVAGPSLDLSYETFTIQSLPGQTVDAIFDWTGKDLGWDIYGSDAATHPHTCNGTGLDADPTTAAEASLLPAYDTNTREYCPDHGKPIPVSLPDPLSLTFGGFWGGSPYLGTLALLPPGQGGLNPDAGYTYMWHSHTEKELTNYDVFPGGMMTMLIIEPMGVPIP